MNNYDTLIILDFDDTLMPSSWAIKNIIDINNPLYKTRYIEFFTGLDNVLSKFLKNILKYGKVVIISNAMTKWISISLYVLPNTKKIINKYIDVISARDLYKKKYPGDGYTWKKLVFKELVAEYFTDKYKNQNIISIGDAPYEHLALISLYKNFRNKKRLLKSIRMIQSPDYEQILDQLDVLNNSFHDIYTRNDHADLKFLDKRKIRMYAN